VAALRQLVDDARGTTTLSVVALAMGRSEQWLSNKLGGRRQFTPPEVVELAAALHLDAIELACTLWPDLGAADRLAELRRITAGATPEQMSLIEAHAERIMSDDTAQRARSRARRTGT
jgi:sugar phosphate isomerase/epimerase